MSSADGRTGVQPLPPATHLIHVGPPKTGSTAIQQAMHQSRPALAAAGVHYAGQAVRPKKAGWALGLEGRPAGSQPPPMTFWETLVEDVASAGDQRVVVSNEDFGRAEPHQIRRIVEELGGGRPHVVAVARRVDRFLPSQWQERVKAGKPYSWEEYLRLILDRPDLGYGWDRSAEGYHWERSDAFYAHDTEALVRHWTDVVGPENFTVVVSDDSDRDFIPHAFEAMLELPAGTLPPPQRNNASLHWAATEFVRELNVLVLEHGLSVPDRRDLLSKGMVHELLMQPQQSAGQRVPPLPTWALAAVQQIARRRVDGIRASGVNVVGDLDQLLVPDDLPTADEIEVPYLDPALAAWASDWFVRRLLQVSPTGQVAAAPAAPAASAASASEAAKALLAGGRRAAGRALGRVRKLGK